MKLRLNQSQKNKCLPITWVLQDAGLKEISEIFQKIPAKNFSIFQFFRNFKKWKKFLLEIRPPPDFRFAVARTSQSPFPMRRHMSPYVSASFVGLHPLDARHTACINGFAKFRNTNSFTSEKFDGTSQIRRTLCNSFAKLNRKYNARKNI